MSNLRHPDDNLLAAFVEGRLSGSELASVVAHLEQCPACLDLAGGSAALLRELEAAPVRPGARWLPLALAASLLIVAGFAAWALWLRKDPSAQLIAALGELRERPVAGRLDGVGYAPHVVLRSGEASSDLSATHVRQLAASLLEEGGDSAPRKHAAGLAALVEGDVTRSVGFLREAAERAPEQARYWSDLAAALLEHPDGQEAEALRAAERALAVDPRSRAAKFNRALALERLGRNEEALAAWESIRRLEAGTPWAVEAAEREARLRGRTAVP